MGPIGASYMIEITSSPSVALVQRVVGDIDKDARLSRLATTHRYRFQNRIKFPTVGRTKTWAGRGTMLMTFEGFIAHARF